jgi:hypothetical protein
MTTINVAPTARAVASLAVENAYTGRGIGSTEAIAILALEQGLGDVTIDRLRVRLFVEPSVAELAIGE